MVYVAVFGPQLLASVTVTVYTPGAKLAISSSAEKGKLFLVHV